MTIEEFNRKSKHITISSPDSRRVLIKGLETNMEFTIGLGHFHGQYYLNNSKGPNDALFKLIGVDSMSYIESILGYHPEPGQCPYMRTIDDVLTVLLHIDKDLFPEEQEITISPRIKKKRYTFKFNL